MRKTIAMPYHFVQLVARIMSGCTIMGGRAGGQENSNCQNGGKQDKSTVVLKNAFHCVAFKCD